MCILLFPFPKIKNPQKSLDVFLFRSLQLYWSVTILLDLLGKKWKFRLLRPLQQPILNWSSSLVLCLMPGCNMFGEVMASHIILRNTTTTNYVTGKPYTHIIRWPILSPKVVHSKIVFAIFITLFQFPSPFSPGHILHIISNKIWPLWNPDFFSSRSVFTPKIWVVESITDLRIQRNWCEKAISLPDRRTCWTNRDIHYPVSMLGDTSETYSDTQLAPWEYK